MNRTFARTGAAAASIVMAGAGMIFMASPAEATTFTVNSTADAHDSNPGNGTCSTSSGTCTLRAAIEEANAKADADTVTIPAGTYTVTEGRIEIAGSTTLNGAGAATTIISGGNSDPVFRVRTQEYLVCDSTLDRVRRYDGAGAITGIFASGGGLDRPISATIGRDNDVFVGAYSSGVHRYDGATGADEGVFVPPAVSTGVSDIAYGPSSSGTVYDDNLYVANYGIGGNITRRNGTTGASMGTFVADGSGGLRTPNSLAFKSGSLYVTSASTNQVLKYNGTTGASQGTFVSASSGGLSTPRDLMFAPDGSLLVSSWDNDKVLRYNGTTGAFISELVTAGSGGLDRPTDLAVGFDGSLLVISQGTKQVLKYNIATGAYIGVLIQGGTATIQQPSCILPRTGVGVGPTVTINKLTIADGSTVSTDAGAGLFTDPGSRTFISNSVIRDNKSGIYGGGISNWGEMEITGTTISGNEVPLSGGGVTSTGGGIFNTGRLTINQSLITDNRASRGGGIANNNSGTVDMRNVTLSANYAVGGGGGVRNVAGLVRISQSTITLNRANEPGFSGSEPRKWGGGIQSLNDAPFQIGGSIIAGNTDNRTKSDAEYSPDCYNVEAGDIVSHRYNVWGVVNTECVLRDAGGSASTPTDRKGTETTPLSPGLSALASNGGLTKTHALASTSPAVDYKSAGSGTSFFNCTGSDQRTYTRPADGNGDGSYICDTGAYERNGSLPLTIYIPPHVIDAFLPLLCPPGSPICVNFTDLNRLQLAALRVVSLSPKAVKAASKLPQKAFLQLLGVKVPAPSIKPSQSTQTPTPPPTQTAAPTPTPTRGPNDPQ